MRFYVNFDKRNIRLVFACLTAWPDLTGGSRGYVPINYEISRLYFRYMKIYGLKFSKEDHIALIKLFYELLTIPSLEPTRINKFASTLSFLLK